MNIGNKYIYNDYSIKSKTQILDLFLYLNFQIFTKDFTKPTIKQQKY